MLFNSYEFIFVFLPITVAGFLLFGRASRELALGWLIVASVCFYAWWRPLNLLIIGPSLIVNYVFARILLRLAADETRTRTKTIVLTLGIIFNLGMLGFFKYANFGVSVFNDLSGSGFVLEHVILPLGISFITFQKIAFLVDISGGRVKTFNPRDFLLFVMFFPQLIAGPIVHYREMIPQFERAACSFEAKTYALGVTLFCFGLFKKVVLADGIASYVTPVFNFAAAGGVITLFQAWLAALGFTLQIYFDFSGYSDMACGAALFFGVRLPMNFDSPLQATSIIDFWLRWHITLTRFLTGYIYNPISLTITRRRMARGRTMLRGRAWNGGAFVQLLAAPTLITMAVSGVWHGAGYTFIIWGVIHGLYLVINHAWRIYLAPSPARGERKEERPLRRLCGIAATLLAVVFAMVFFRALDVASALSIVKGMLGFQGVALPGEIASFIGMPWLPPLIFSTRRCIRRISQWVWSICSGSLLLR